MGSFALISPAKGQKQRPSPRLAKRGSILNKESPRTALVAGGAASLEVFKYTQVYQEEFAPLGRFLVGQTSGLLLRPGSRCRHWPYSQNSTGRWCSVQQEMVCEDAPGSC